MTFLSYFEHKYRFTGAFCQG